MINGRQSFGFIAVRQSVGTAFEVIPFRSLISQLQQLILTRLPWGLNLTVGETDLPLRTIHGEV
jgi:hypothetical protein